MKLISTKLYYFILILYSINLWGSKNDNDFVEDLLQGKNNIIVLSILNNTNYLINNPLPWFESGQLIEGEIFPESISSGNVVKIKMCAEYESTLGCSGYVEYMINSGKFTIAYANPAREINRIGCGLGSEIVWNTMDSHYAPADVFFTVNDIIFKASIRSSGGNINNALVDISNN